MPTPARPPIARLGLPSATALVVANMVGVGVFTTSGYALGDLGTRGRVLAAWLVAGGIALCGALSYGALARRIVASGGEYTFLSRTLHPLAGFLAGWVSLLAGFTGPIAAAALGLGVYLGPELGLEPRWIATSALVLAGLQHGLRLRAGVLSQNGAVAVKLVLLGAFLVWAAGRLAAPSPVEPGLVPAFDPGAFAVALVWISLSYSGWNAAVYLSEEVREPARNVPRALLLGALLVMGLYLALNAVFLWSSADMARLAGRADVAAAAAEALGGPPARRTISLLVALALWTSVSSMTMLAPRVYERMSADGLFPRLLRRRGEVPRAALLFQSSLAIVVVWATELRELLEGLGFVLGLSAAATVTGLLVLRRRLGAAAVPAIGAPWVPATYVGATLAASLWMAQRKPEVALVSLGVVLLGVPLYALARRRGGAQPPPA